MKTPTAPRGRAGMVRLITLATALLTGIGGAVSPSVSPWESILSVDGTNGAENENFPEMVASGNTLHLVYTSNVGYNHLYLNYRRSTDAGATWNNRVMLHDFGGKWQEALDGQTTRLAVDGNHVHVVQLRSVDGWNFEIDYYRSTDGGATFEAKRSLASSAQYWWYYSPRVAASQGKVVIAFNQNPNWYYNPSGFLLVSGDNGSTFNTKPVLVGTGATCMDIRAEDGRILSVWKSPNDAWVVSSEDAGTTLKEVKVSSSSGATESPDAAKMRPQLCAITEDAFHVAWVQFLERGAGNWKRALFYSRSTDGGATFETARALSETAIGSDQVRSGGRGSLVARGSRVYAAYVTEAGGLWLQASGNSGSTFGNPVPLHVDGSTLIGNGDYPQLALDPSDDNGATMWFACSTHSPFSGRSANIVGHTTDGGQTIDPVLSPAHPWAWGNFTPYCFQLVPIAAESGTLWSLLYTGVRPGYDADLFFRPLDPAPDPSMDNQVLHLDPAGVRADHVQIPSISGLDAQGFTIEAWVRISAGLTYDRGLEILQWGALDDGLAFRANKDASGKHYFSAWLNGVQVGGTTATSSGDWHHLALIYNPSLASDHIRFYLDGVPDGMASQSKAFHHIAEPLFIGGARSGWGLEPLHGDIDNLRVHARPLSNDELIASASTDEVTGLEPGLLAAFGFDATTMDVTGNGHDGLLQFGADFIADSGRPAPDITLEQPPGTPLVSGAARSYGACAIGTGTTMGFTVRNTGGMWLSGLKVSKSGAQAADFTISPPIEAKLGPGKSTTFSVTFKPAAKGLRKAMLKIASNDPAEPAFIINLSGSGILAPEIVVEQPAGSGLVDGTAKKSFGTVKTGKTGTAKVFTIKNTGSADLTGLAISKNGANSADFLVTSPVKTALKPGDKTTFSVTFKPKAKGLRNAAIHIKSNDANENPFDIKLAGEGM